MAELGGGPLGRYRGAIRQDDHERAAVRSKLIDKGMILLYSLSTNLAAI